MPKKEARKEHKELVREQKEAAARAARRGAAMRRGLVAVILVAAVGGGIMLLTQQRDDSTTASDSPGASGAATDVATLLSQAESAAKQAGCTDTENVGPYDPEDEDGSHDGAAPFDSYPSSPPTSGPHSEQTVASGTYDEPLDMGAALHSLEHGAVTVWYAPSAEGTPELAEIKAFVEDDDDHVIVAPFDYPDEGAEGNLPEGAAMTLTAWHFTRSCDELSLPVMADFLSKYRTPPLGDRDYVGEAPEPNTPI